MKSASSGGRRVGRCPSASTSTRPKYENLQTSTPGAITNVNGFSNFGDGTSKGLDYEIQWRTPMTGLILSWVGNTGKSEFDRVAPAVQAALPLFRAGRDS